MFTLVYYNAESFRGFLRSLHFRRLHGTMGDPYKTINIMDVSTAQYFARFHLVIHELVYNMLFNTKINSIEYAY